MAHINLLPWREGQRQEQKKQYLTILVAIGLMILAIVWTGGAVIDNLIANQNQRNQYLEQQITVLDTQIAKIKGIKEDKKAIEQRMALIEQLQTSRNVAPHILDELAILVPPGLSFRTMYRKGNLIEIIGVSESNNRLSAFMRRLEESTVFLRGDLSSIKADTSASDAVSEFKITFNISPTVAPDFAVAEGGKK
jgi:type IV pilus assembly protein PilN